MVVPAALMCWVVVSMLFKYFSSFFIPVKKCVHYVEPQVIQMLMVFDNWIDG